MQPARFTITPIVDTDGLALQQSVSAAGYITLNGALISNGSWTGTNGGQRVVVMSAGNDSGITFTVYGNDVDGHSVAEAKAGANAGATTFSAYMKYVSGIYASAASAGTITAGFTGQSASPSYVPNYKMENFKAALAVTVTGTINATVQHTFDDVWSTSWREASATWFPHDDTDMVALTTNQNGNYAFPPTACRTIVNSAGTVSAAVFTVIVPS